MKKTLIFFILIKSFTLFSQSSLDKDLIVYYPFDGNTIDQSGNGYHTISFATLAKDRLSEENSAYHFNGIDEYIDLPNIAALKPQLPLTISFWVSFDDLDVKNSFIFTTDFAENINSGVNMSLTSSKSSLAVAFGNGDAPSINSRRTKVGSSEVKANTWYFVVVTVVGVDDMNIYLSEYNYGVVCVNDGGEYSGNGLSMIYSDNPGSIGRKDAHSSLDPYYFKGKIDDFRMWNRALTIEEIGELCNLESVLAVEDENGFNKNIFYQRTYENIKIINQIGDIEIYNILGVKLMSEKSVNDYFDVSSLKTGVYIIHFKNKEGKIFNYKFLK